MEKIDYQRLFESAPDCYLIVLPDAKFTIVEATEAYAQVTQTKREQILGKGVFEIFPDNPNDPKATGVANITASFNRVITQKAPDQMVAIKYDIPLKDGSFEEKYWSTKNYPILDEAGQVIYILNAVTDVTKSVQLEKSQALLMEKVRMTDQELVEKIQEVEKMNLFLASRDLKVQELKKENEQLREKIQN